MSNLPTIFNHEEFGEIRTAVITDANSKRDLFVNGEKLDKFTLLALASKIGDNNEQAGWDIMRLASILHHPENDFVFNELYKAVGMEITRNNQRNEYGLYPLFEKNIKEILGNKAKIVKRKNHPDHMPDFWVQIDKETMPVEIKIKNFDKKALRQLKRYMEFYKTNRGVAVGERLATTLPNNIIFVSTRELGV